MSKFRIRAMLWFLVLPVFLVVSACGGGKKKDASNQTASSDSNQNLKETNGGLKIPSIPEATGGVNLNLDDVEGYYHFQFRISTWNWVCTNKDGVEKSRIKDGVTQNSWSGAYGWYYKIERGKNEGEYLLSRFMNSDLDEFDHEYEKNIPAKITPNGQLTVDQTFEYGIYYTNAQESLKMNASFISEKELKGYYLHFSDIREGSLKSCSYKGEFTMKKVDL